MAKISIYLPDDLKERMEARPQDNWSSIAQGAFELQLKSTLKGDEDMSAVIERLRASKERGEERERPEWAQKGRTWAMQVAEYDALKRVVQISEYDVNPMDGTALLTEFLNGVAGKRLDHSEQRGLCDEIFAARHLPSNKQMEWFLLAATEVWNEVEDEL